MTKERVVLDSDLRYLDKGNLFQSRSELSVAKMLSFLGHDYQYDVDLELPNGKSAKVDFKAGSKYIEVIDSEADVAKFKQLREQLPNLDIIAVGHSKYASKIKEMDSLFFFDSADHMQTGSIFIEDPSLAFDYAHILPLVEKCSVLHGHTSTVMVEVIGSMKNNLVVDLHYYVAFDGPKGYFSLQVPKSTTYMLSGEATVENLSSEIIRLLAPKMPQNVQALGVYIYEGVNKGAHIIAGVKKED